MSLKGFVTNQNKRILEKFINYKKLFKLGVLRIFSAMGEVLIKREPSDHYIHKEEEESGATTKKIKISDVRSLVYFKDEPEENFEITELNGQDQPLENTSTPMMAKIQKTIKQGPKIKCSYCFLSSYDKAVVRNHITTNHQIYECSSCNFKTPHLNLFNLHVKKQHIHPKKLVNQVLIPPVLTNYRCHNCRVVLPINLKKSHQESCIQFTCKFCKFKCWNKDTATKHSLLHLPNFICSIKNCTFITQDRKAFDDHSLVHKIKKEDSQKSTKKPQTPAGPIKFLKCQDCYLSFRDSTALETHREEVHEES